MKAAERNAALIRRVAAAGDVVAELLGVACARNAHGDRLSAGQTQSIRDAILTWHQIKADAVTASRGQP